MWHTHTHTTHARTRARARTHTHTHTYISLYSLGMSFLCSASRQVVGNNKKQLQMWFVIDMCKKSAYMHIQVIHKRMVRFQKLTRNLFLTLHGHNLHRQQRQLSNFLMRYQQFVSHAYCGAAGPVSKMTSQQEKAFCVTRFEVRLF